MLTPKALLSPRVPTPLPTMTPWSRSRRAAVRVSTSGRHIVENLEVEVRQHASVHSGSQSLSAEQVAGESLTRLHLQGDDEAGEDEAGLYLVRTEGYLPAIKRGTLGVSETPFIPVSQVPPVTVPMSWQLSSPHPCRRSYQVRLSLFSSATTTTCPSDGGFHRGQPETPPRRTRK